MQIQAAVLQNPDGTLTRRRIRIEAVELEPPRAGEVLVRVTSCGVCGTDRGCLHGLEPCPTPGVLGHEGAGIVEEVTPFEAVYGATKAFLRSFGESLHTETKDTGIGVTVLMPGPTDTNFFHRADMDDTKVGAGSKDDPAMVARAAFDALMSGQDKVVAGLHDKLMVGVNTLRSEQAAAESHRKLPEPGSAPGSAKG